MGVELHKNATPDLCHAPRVDGVSLKTVDPGDGNAHQAAINDAQISGTAMLYWDDATGRLATQYLTPNRVAVSNTSGIPVASAVTTAEVGVLSGISTSLTTADLNALVNLAASNFSVGEGNPGGRIISFGSGVGDVWVNFADANNSEGGIMLAGVQLQATATDLNKLIGYTGDTTDLNKVVIPTDGRVIAHKCVIVDSNRDLNLTEGGNIRNLSIDGDGLVRGDLTVLGTINATIEGVSDMANRWTNNLTINFTGDTTGSATFNGSESSISVPLTANHEHPYLPLVGNDSGTPITGTVNLNNNIYLSWQTTGGLWRGMIRFNSLDRLVLGHTDYATILTGNDLSFYNGSGTYAVFHSGHMGADSGLDADLLDGQHGSYYRNAGNINAGVLASSRGGLGFDPSVLETNELVRWAGGACAGAGILNTDIVRKDDINILADGSSIVLPGAGQTGGEFYRNKPIAFSGLVGDSAWISHVEDYPNMDGGTSDWLVFTKSDGNATPGFADGGFAFEVMSYDGDQATMARTELLRMAYQYAEQEFGVFEWMGNDILHAGNINSFAFPATRYDHETLAGQSYYYIATGNHLRLSQNRLEFIGPNSYINGSGSDIYLHAAASGAQIQLRSGATDAIALICNASGYNDVGLRYNGSTKLETKDHGIEVFGTVRQDTQAFYAQITSATCGVQGQTSYHTMLAGNYYTPLYDTGSGWSAPAGEWTCQEPGIYMITAHITWDNRTWYTGDYVEMRVMGEAGALPFAIACSRQSMNADIDGDYQFTQEATTLRYLSAGVKVYLEIYFSTNFADALIPISNRDTSYFAIALLNAMDMG